MGKRIVIVFLMCAGWCDLAIAHAQEGLQIEILVGGVPVPEFWHEGIYYIEATQGKEYAIRLTNHLNSRGAVALSVDGLNTIDARHTTAYNSRKWVLEPHESVVISGWQINYHNARRFFFTTEEQSYAKQLGQMANLGIISAVLFKEKDLCVEVSSGRPKDSFQVPEAHSTNSKQEPLASSPNSKSAHADRSVRQSVEVTRDQPMDGEYAATGFGREARHEVRWVHLDLDPRPVTSVSFRYEFRPTLIRLGILPTGPRRTALERRQRAEGFIDEGFCPRPR